jgi:phage terminase Nu1 subunit (DNA packaging protein)
MTDTLPKTRRPRKWKRQDDVVLVTRGTGRFAEFAEMKKLDARSAPMRARSRLIDAFAKRLDPRGMDALDLFTRDVIKKLATMSITSQVAEIAMMENPSAVTSAERLDFSTCLSNWNRLAASIGLVDDKVRTKDRGRKTKHVGPSPFDALKALAAKGNSSA